jgi:hypothetical protein
MLGWARRTGLSIVADLPPRSPRQLLEAEPTAQDAVLGHWIWVLVITKVATGLLVNRCVCRAARLLRQRSAPSCRVHSLDLIKLCFAGCLLDTSTVNLVCCPAVRFCCQGGSMLLCVRCALVCIVVCSLISHLLKARTCRRLGSRQGGRAIQQLHQPWRADLADGPSTA